MTKIAVVEDNPDNRLLVRAILEQSYAVCEYPTGAEALSGFDAEPPDLVLLDISLPGMDGLEVLGRIRADTRLRGLPVIALTAHVMEAERKQFLAAGFDGYVAKPITDKRDLLDTIERLIERLP